MKRLAVAGTAMARYAVNPFESIEKWS